MIEDDFYATLKLNSGEDLFARVASHYADDNLHAQRLYNYISQLWFMPATPVLSNGGTTRGLPISCFLNEAGDSLNGILDLWSENVWLAARGGGIGSYWGNLRSIGEKIGKVGKTVTKVPVIKTSDAVIAPLALKIKEPLRLLISWLLILNEPISAFENVASPCAVITAVFVPTAGNDKELAATAASIVTPHAIVPPSNLKFEPVICPFAFNTNSPLELDIAPSLTLNPPIPFLDNSFCRSLTS